MKIIGYKEMYPNRDLPFMKDNLEQNRYPMMEKIVTFLKNGTQLFTSQRRQTDVFTGERIPIQSVFMQAGEYKWSSSLAYYVEKYNLRLPRDFEDYILNHK